MKKTVLLGALMLSLFISPLSVHASRNEDKPRGFMKKVQERVLEIMERRDATPEGKKLEKMENKNETEDENEHKNQNREEKQEKNGKFINIVDGVVMGISGSTLTVEKEGTRYNVLTDSSTKCRRHFWGKCDISEIAVDNHVNVWGREVTATTTLPTNEITIRAEMIRNLSVLKRNGVFIGTIISKDADSFVMDVKGRGTIDVSTAGTIKLIDRRQRAIALSDIVTGHRVRVRGLWDKTAGTLTEVKEIKDFSLPAQSGTSPTPSTSVTPSPTVSTSPAPTATNTPTPTATPTSTPTPTPTP